MLANRVHGCSVVDRGEVEYNWKRPAPAGCRMDHFADFDLKQVSYFSDYRPRRAKAKLVGARLTPPVGFQAPTRRPATRCAAEQ